MFKIAISAGHCLTTAGKRLPKKLDPNQTREWVLNDRISRYQEEAALQYEDVEVLRLDNRDGSEGNDNVKRAKKAMYWGADILFDNHHNAGIHLGKGGGIVAFSHKDKTEGADLRDVVYAACIAAGGLKGNRAAPKQAKAYTILKNFKGPGVLMEYGFMDSKTDAPVILTEEYAKKMGYASIEAVAKKYGLKKKSGTNNTTENKTETKSTGGTCKVEVKVLKKGAKGNEVKALQALLIGYGYSCGDKGVDGSFGASTDTALRKYQKDNKLTVDGSCGPKTWKKLLGLA